MSSLLRDLTDMGIAVNPDVSSPDAGGAQGGSNSSGSGQKSKVVSLFSSHWDKGSRLKYLSNGLLIHCEHF